MGTGQRAVVSSTTQPKHSLSGSMKRINLESFPCKRVEMSEVYSKDWPEVSRPYKTQSRLNPAKTSISLGVEGSAVLVAVLVWFSLVPVLKAPWSSRHPAPATLVVHVSGAHPPGVLPVPTGGDGEVGVDLVSLLLVLRLGQVGVLEVAALHGVEPVHAVSPPGVAGVAGAGVEALDEHVALVGPL